MLLVSLFLEEKLFLGRPVQLSFPGQVPVTHTLVCKHCRHSLLARDFPLTSFVRTQSLCEGLKSQLQSGRHCRIPEADICSYLTVVDKPCSTAPSYCLIGERSNPASHLVRLRWWIRTRCKLKCTWQVLCFTLGPCPSHQTASTVLLVFDPPESSA